MLGYDSSLYRAIIQLGDTDALTPFLIHVLSERFSSEIIRTLPDTEPLILTNIYPLDPNCKELLTDEFTQETLNMMMQEFQEGYGSQPKDIRGYASLFNKYDNYKLFGTTLETAIAMQDIEPYINYLKEYWLPNTVPEQVIRAEFRKGYREGESEPNICSYFKGFQ